MISNDDYIKWGVKSFEEAKIIYKLKHEHLSSIQDVVKELNRKYISYNISVYELFRIKFRSHGYTNSTLGPKELMVYWLNYLLSDLPWFDKNTPIEIGAKEILNDTFKKYILNEFNIHAHFSGGKFLIDRFQPDKFDLSIHVPYCLDYVNVVFGILMLEKLTNLKVKKISLWYFTHEITMTEMGSEIVVGLDDLDAKQKYSGSSSISKQYFLELNPSSRKEWFREIPAWQIYIKEIDLNTIKCKVCNEKEYSSSEEWYCRTCNHSLDKNGNCIDNNCNLCKSNLLPF